MKFFESNRDFGFSVRGTKSGYKITYNDQSNVTYFLFFHKAHKGAAPTKKGGLKKDIKQFLENVGLDSDTVKKGGIQRAFKRIAE